MSDFVLNELRKVVTGIEKITVERVANNAIVLIERIERENAAFSKRVEELEGDLKQTGDILQRRTLNRDRYKSALEEARDEKNWQDSEWAKGAITMSYARWVATTALPDGEKS